jgi:hypothetical protein
MNAQTRSEDPVPLDAVQHTGNNHPEDDLQECETKMKKNKYYIKMNE